MVKNRGEKEGMRLGKYEIGRTLGEGNFGKVKLARNVDSGQPFAVKILDRKRILSLKIDDQVKREIETLRLLKHPNVVGLYEVLASKTKIYMVLEYVNGGELFNEIESKGKLSECKGRRLFQQLIDAIGYCHGKGVYHRDLKLENLLVDSKGNVKISDFGLSALAQQLRSDGLLHTTCGSPSYIAPEVFNNRGYDGARSDVWSCGVILYVILTGYLPFYDRNLAVLYQKISKGDFKIPKFLSHDAQNLLHKILDPNPITRINVDGIKADVWFKQDYNPVIPYDDEGEDTGRWFGDLSVKKPYEGDEIGKKISTFINAFELIGMSASLDLSGFFETEDVSEWKIRFTSNYLPKDMFKKIEDVVTEMGFRVHNVHGKLKIMEQKRCSSSPRDPGPLSVVAEVFEVCHSLYVVELRKASGDSLLYRHFWSKLSGELGVHIRKNIVIDPECP